MPTYLTPGVYVEEVPSANKPIEGVSTSVAAFVGLTPGGPVNTPMRISNWTQFAKIFGDPANPDNGPFMEGAYLAHAVYGFFQNGGSNCWIVRVGEETGRGARAAGRASGGGGQRRRGLPRPGAPERRRRRRGRADRGAARRARATRPTGWSSRPAARSEEYDGLTLKKGRNNLATKVNAVLQADQDRGDRRVAARGAARPGHRQVHALGAGAGAVRGQARATSPVTRRSARAWAAWPPSTR